MLILNTHNIYNYGMNYFNGDKLNAYQIVIMLFKHVTKPQTVSHWCL